MDSKIRFKVPELLKKMINIVEIITPFNKYGITRIPLNRFKPRNLPFTNTAKANAKINCGMATSIYHKQFLKILMYWGSVNSLL